jgi:hypothetical protein
MTGQAQFKEIPPAPYTPAVARQKIRTLIRNTDPRSSQPTIETLSGLLVWYRDVVDDELTAAWKTDDRANLPAVVTALSDAKVASAIIDFSWRQQRTATFNLTYAPMLGDLMARYEVSADPFLHDLRDPAVSGAPMPALLPSEADAVCRILLDMPDSGNWKRIALQVLPHYRPAAQALLVQDLHGANQDKTYRAQFWLSDLKWTVPGTSVPGISNDQPTSRRVLTMRNPASNQTTSAEFSQRPHIVGQAGQVGQAADSPAPYPMPYIGPTSGTLKCSGAPVPPDAEYVFPGMPPGNIQLDLEGKPWAARLVPRGETQDLILKNKGASPQKRCTVHWSIVP